VIATPVRATVLIPTHDHGPLLEYSLRSALAQTIQDIEVLVIGDGVGDDTRSVLEVLRQKDERIRFFDNPKGPRHGEIHRHAALGEARGRIVCYLSDDDLWFPHHLETMEHLLGVTDLAHTLPVFVLPDGTVEGSLGDLALPEIRQRLLDGLNFIPLSCVGHTLDAYRRLPFGWRTTPEGTHTDLYMWQQFLAKPDCRCLSSSKLTVAHFPSPARTRLSDAERKLELASWARRLQDAPDELPEAALDYYVRECLRYHLALGDRERRLEALESTASALRAAADEPIAVAEQARRDLIHCQQRLTDVTNALEHRQRDLDRAAQERAAYETELQQLRVVLGELRKEIEGEREARTASEQELGRVYGTVTWRLRRRLLSIAGVRRVVEVRAAARPPAGGAAP
jgi:hypothetical protein